MKITLNKNINNNHFNDYISAFNIALSNKTGLSSRRVRQSRSIREFL